VEVSFLKGFAAIGSTSGKGGLGCHENLASGSICDAMKFVSRINETQILSQQGMSHLEKWLVAFFKGAPQAQCSNICQL